MRKNRSFHLPKKPVFGDAVDIPGYNVLGSILAKAKAKEAQGELHGCLNCQSGDRLGCENCEHDWMQLPNCGEFCKDCEISFP